MIFHFQVFCKKHKIVPILHERQEIRANLWAYWTRFTSVQVPNNCLQLSGASSGISLPWIGTSVTSSPHELIGLYFLWVRSEKSFIPPYVLQIVLEISPAICQIMHDFWPSCLVSTKLHWKNTDWKSRIIESSSKTAILCHHWEEDKYSPPPLQLTQNPSKWFWNPLFHFKARSTCFPRNL